ncbi:prepilin peptidase [Nocardia cyriacigeorgica]|uniref:Prepilin peptidase n=1 Tax=Nocardia cyriacigeorgica TaxID=135487 RepID=A0A5R8P911_9NOCA|nr:prepilin peptidase [Nocardia cyriacigeorgica]
MEIFALIALGAWCMALSVSDIRTRRLPDLLTGPGAVVVLAYAAATGRLAAALVGAVLLSVPYLMVHLVTPAAFGAGDVKLAVGLGAAAGMCGGQAWAWAAVGAPVLTAVAGIAALVLPRRTRPLDQHTLRTTQRGAEGDQVVLAQGTPGADDGRGRCSAAADPIDSSAGSVRDPRRPRQKHSLRRPRTHAPATTSAASPVTVPHGPSMCVATLLAVGFG